MKEKRDIRLSWESVFDIADAQDWIELKFGLSESKKYENELKSFLWNKLRISAGIVGKTGIFYRGYMIYKTPYKVANIFYFIEDDVVYIIRILRQEQDWEKKIGHGEGYTFF